jgi:hypothetical protein
MDDLDPTVAERLLGEYPELLDHWRQEMSRHDRRDHYGDHGLRRMHDPAYLGEVVREHRSLLDGTSQPDEKLARRCEEIVVTFRPVRDERARHLVDPWFRARVEPYDITKLYDPEYLPSSSRLCSRSKSPSSNYWTRADPKGGEDHGCRCPRDLG